MYDALDTKDICGGVRTGFKHYACIENWVPLGYQQVHLYRLTRIDLIGSADVELEQTAEHIVYIYTTQYSPVAWYVILVPTILVPTRTKINFASSILTECTYYSEGVFLA